MRRLPRLQPLRAIPQSAAAPAPFRALSTTRASPFRNTAARRSDDKQRQEVLEALERDRQSALSLQSEAEILEEGEEAEIGGGIVIPPEFSYAPAPGAAGDYVPAKSAEGLEEVGGLEGWWDVEGHLSDADRLRVFSERGEKVMDRGVLEVLIRQAVVEGLIVQGKAGGEMLTARWGPSGKEAMSRAAGVEVVVSEAGDVTLTGDLSGVLSGLKESAEAQPAQEAAPEAEAAAEGVPEEAVAEQAEELLTAEEAKEMVKSWDRAWRKVPLTDPSLKFAVRTFPFLPSHTKAIHKLTHRAQVHKRVYQLTGHRLPDSKLAPLRTAQHLLSVLARPPKPLKVLEEIRSPRGRGTDLLNLPNVKVYGRRVTPIDKEVWVGRWKVIEDELVKRGLPVTGTGGVGKAKEKEWLMGRP